MARIKISSTKNSKSYSIIEDYYRNGKRTTKIVEYIGNYNTILELAQIVQEPEEVIIKKYSNKLISKNVTNKFNVGYLFLKDIYYSLKIDKIVKDITKKYKFEFDLNEVLSNLIFSRIIYPSSKLKTFELSKNFIETPKYDLNNIYRGLTYLNNELDYFQKELYNNSKSVIDRNTRIMYFDCTNYYFSINEEDELRKYGKGKDHRPNPLVGMGLFMDGNGLPIAMNIFPGNENETKNLLPLQKQVIKDFNLENDKTIICTDAAMCTDEIKNFNIKDGRSFVITQSIKKLKKDYKKEVFEDDGWRIIGDLRNTYKLSDFLNDEKRRELNYETIFYKIIRTETAHVVQDLIVTFQIKYQDYLRNVRKSQVQRASKKIGNTKKGDKIKLSINPNDYRRFIKEEVDTIKGEIKNKSKEESNSLNEESKKEKYFYTYSID